MNKFYILFILVSLVLFTSCTDDGTPSIQDDQLIHSDWRISQYIKDGKNQTSAFQGYIFDFKSNKALIAQNGTSLLNGSWNAFKDSGREKLLINMNVSEGYFEEISEDWDIIELTSTLIRLEDTSGNSPNEEKDILHFSR